MSGKISRSTKRLTLSRTIWWLGSKYSSKAGIGELH
jgi:hypothetical protein